MLTVLSIAAIVLPVLRSWPQVFRILRTREVEGVSTSAWALMLCNFCMWATYGVAESLPALIITNTLTGLGCACVLFALSRHGTVSPVLPVAIAAVSVGVASTLALLGLAIAVLIVGTILAMVMFVPQVKRVLRSPSDGVSSSTWVIAAIASIVWLAYATAIRRPWIATPHVVMLPCALIILWRTREKRPSWGRFSRSVV